MQKAINRQGLQVRENNEKEATLRKDVQYFLQLRSPTLQKDVQYFLKLRSLEEQAALMPLTIFKGGVSPTNS